MMMDCPAPHEIDALDELSFADLLARYRLPQSVISYWGMWINIVFVVPLDLVAASEAVRTLQDFSRGAWSLPAGGFGRMARCSSSVERCGGRYAAHASSASRSPTAS
jgi:hypothetical protein